MFTNFFDIFTVLFYASLIEGPWIIFGWLLWVWSKYVKYIMQLTSRFSQIYEQNACYLMEVLPNDVTLFFANFGGVENL